MYRHYTVLRYKLYHATNPSRLNPYLYIIFLYIYPRLRDFLFLVVLDFLCLLDFLDMRDFLPPDEDFILFLIDSIPTDTFALKFSNTPNFLYT